ncbi:uncharacterized protein [Cicer arietinum]
MMAPASTSAVQYGLVGQATPTQNQIQTTELMPTSSNCNLDLDLSKLPESIPNFVAPLYTETQATQASQPLSYSVGLSISEGEASFIDPQMGYQYPDNKNENFQPMQDMGMPEGYNMSNEMLMTDSNIENNNYSEINLLPPFPESFGSDPVDSMQRYETGHSSGQFITNQGFASLPPHQNPPIMNFQTAQDIRRSQSQSFMAPLYQAAHGPKPLSNYPQSQNSMQPTFSEPQMEANAGLEMGHQSGQFNRNDGSVIILPYQNQNPIINSQTMQSSRPEHTNYNQLSGPTICNSQYAQNMLPQQHVMLTPSMHQAGHGLETQTISDSQSQIPIRPAFNPVAVNTRPTMCSNYGQQPNLLVSASNSYSIGPAASQMAPPLNGNQNIQNCPQATLPNIGLVQLPVVPHVQQILMSQNRADQVIYNGGMSARMSNLAPQQQGATLQGPSTPSLGTPSSEELGSHVLGFSANRPSEGFVLQYPTSTKAEIVNILRKVEAAKQNKIQQGAPAAASTDHGVPAINQRDKGKLPESTSTRLEQHNQNQLSAPKVSDSQHTPSCLMPPPPPKPRVAPAAPADGAHVNQSDKAKLPESAPIGQPSGTILRRTEQGANLTVVPAPSPTTVDNSANQGQGGKDEPRRRRGRPRKRRDQGMDLSYYGKLQRTESSSGTGKSRTTVTTEDKKVQTTNNHANPTSDPR